MRYADVQGDAVSYVGLYRIRVPVTKVQMLLKIAYLYLFVTKGCAKMWPYVIGQSPK